MFVHLQHIKTHLTRACEHVVFAYTNPVTLAHTPQHKCYLFELVRMTIYTHTVTLAHTPQQQCYLFELVRMTISAALIETDLIVT